jgi:hypothetical protein
MQGLSAAELLGVWELGLAQSPLQRALTLLAAAAPDIPPEALSNLSIGERDARLLTLREWTFGPQLNGLTTCPGCNERLELTFEVSDVRARTESSTAEPGDALSLCVADYEASFRLPNSLDLAAISVSQGIAASREFLFQRCVLTARHKGEDCPAELLPSDIVDAIVAQMAQADPQANGQMALSCPRCGHQWQAVFDIASFFWSEITAWASRILREVHILASAYGWREADILAMSPMRRQIYLEMVSP